MAEVVEQSPEVEHAREAVPFVDPPAAAETDALLLLIATLGGVVGGLLGAAAALAAQALGGSGVVDASGRSIGLTLSLILAGAALGAAASGGWFARGVDLDLAPQAPAHRRRPARLAFALGLAGLLLAFTAAGAAASGVALVIGARALRDDRLARAAAAAGAAGLVLTVALLATGATVLS